MSVSKGIVDEFCEFLEGIWMDNTEDEALELWERQVKQSSLASQRGA